MYRLSGITPNYPIMVVGCGGTGGFVAGGLCRLLIDRPLQPLILVDHDRVEESNLGRQNFYQEDLGRFKSQVLAERLSAAFNREIEYSVSPIDQMSIYKRGVLTIGCVDNPTARKALQYCGYYSMGNGKFSYQRMQGWYIDSGNGEHSGQVLIGNSLLKELHRSFIPSSGVCHNLPLPTIQQPALLAPQKKVRRNCAQAVQAAEQSPVINQMMAGLVLTFVHKLLTGTLSWMGAYIDLENGSLSTVPCDPEIVARMTGLTVRQLEYRPRPLKFKNEVRVRV